MCAWPKLESFNNGLARIVYIDTEGQVSKHTVQLQLSERDGTKGVRITDVVLN